MRKKFTLLLASLFLVMGTAWAENVLFDANSTPTLPGTLTSGQYHFTSPKFTAPENFTTLRLTFFANSNNESPAGYPCITIAEFYLYDKNGDKVTLTAGNFSSNATLNDANEGSVDALFDGATSGSGYKWYWHSEWKNNVGDFHYLEINVSEIENDLSEFSFGYVTRREQASPAEMLVTTGSSTKDVAAQYSSYQLFNGIDLANQAFRIRNANVTSENLYLTIETPNANDQNEDGVKILAFAVGNDSQSFRFIPQSNGSYQIKSLNNYFLNTHASWGFNAIDDADGERSEFTLNYIGNGEFRIQGLNGFIGPNDNYTTGHPYELFSNHTKDKQYIDWILEPYSQEYLITYNYKVDGVTMLTEEMIVNVGEAHPEVKTFYGVNIAESKPEGNVAENKTVDFTCTVDASKFPFTYFADAASINSWEYIQMHSNNKRYLKYESSYIAWADAQPAALGKKDAYAWAFVGNPFVGFKMVNKAATTAKALKSNNSGNPAMADYAGATAFFAAASDVSGAQYFCMQYPGGNYLNAQSGKVAHWGDNDAGSTMCVSACPEYTLANYLADLNTLIGNAETFVNDNNANKNKLGYYIVTDVMTQLDDAKKYTNSKSFDEVDAAFVALQNVLNNPAVNLPVAGKFYRIKNNNGSGYLSGDAAKTGRVQFKAEIGDKANSVFYFDNVKLVSYVTGLYLAKGTNEAMVHYTETVGADAGTNFTFKKSPTLGKLLIEFDDNNRSFHSAGTGESNAAGAGQNGDPYRFTVEEVTWLPVQISSKYGYGTLCSPVALSTYAWQSTTSYRVEAYVGNVTTAGEESWLSLTRIDKEDGVIPANTPVVLKLNNDVDADSYKDGCVYLQTSNSTKGKIESDLKGTLKTEKAADTGVIYTLQANESEDGVVFGKYVNKDETVPNVNGFRAYLPLKEETVAGAISIRFEGTTDIEHSEIRNQHSEMIFDLLGRRVEAITKGGIYIVNGKKVVVK